MNLSQLTQRELELERLIYHDTYKKIELSYFEEIGIDAHTLSLDLFLDRANISRTLNKLTRLGFLSKINGRPTRFLSKRAFEYFYKDLFIPEVFATNKSIESYIIENSKTVAVHKNEFLDIIGSNKDESLYRIVNALKAAVAYPPIGLDTLVIGEYSSGKRALLEAVQRHLITQRLIKSTKDIHLIDCSYADNLFSTLTDLLVQTTERQMVFLYNLDKLDSKNLDAILNFIIDKKIWCKKERDFKKINTTFLASYNLAPENENLDHIKSRFSKIIYIPNFDDKTVLERLKLILVTFQREVNNINKTLKLSKNIINCFIISRFENNMFELQNNIKVTLANAIYREPAHSTMFEIDFDDIPDSVLDNMVNNPQEANELYEIYNQIDTDTLYFYPNSKNNNITQLNKLSLEALKDMETIQTESSIQMVAQKMIKEALKVDHLNVTNIKNIDLDIKSSNVRNFILSYISKLVHELKDQSYRPKVLTLPLESTLHKEIEDIIHTLQTTENIIIPPVEKHLLNELYANALKLQNKVLVEICIISNLESISNTYHRFASALKNTREVHTLSIQTVNSICKTDKERNEYFQNYINEIDSGKGVLILVESELEEYITKYAEKITIPYLIIPNLNIHLLEQIIRKSNDHTLFVDDFKNFNYASAIEYATIQNEDQSLIRLIEKEILEESLLFINPKKILNLSLDIFNHIIIELGLPYTEMRAVQFITHVSFMMERIVRGEKLTYKNINEYVNLNEKPLNIVSKHMMVYTHQFGINIPQEELIYITEIFLN